MNFTKLALKRPVSCILIIVALVVFGISSIFGFKMELTPDMELPMLMVITTYPGADPESVDELVTSVIEDAGSVMSGIDSVISQSEENVSMVMFSYDYGVDIDTCYDDLRAALDAARLELPDDAGTPAIMEMNMNAQAIYEISATETGDIDLLKVINDSIVPELETITGVADVTVGGGSEDYISIELQPDQLKQYGLTMTSITGVLGNVDFSYPAGSVEQGDQNISVSTSVDCNTVQQLQKVPIMTSTGQTITLDDVANVYMATNDAQSVSRYNGNENVSISLQKNQSYGTVNVCSSIEKELARIQSENPGIEFETTYSASEAILSSLESVGQTLVVGVILSMFVLFLFFGDFKASLIVGSSMPISLFVTMILMNFMGFSLNIVTMGALVIAIGMMVDSSIVVIESCFRAKDEGLGFRQAALDGTKEITASIVASTITTIVVYLPLASMAGLSGQMFSQLGYTIVFAMMASLISALTLVPLFYNIFKPKEKKDIPINKILNRVSNVYERILRKVLNKKIIVVGVTIAMIVVTVLLASTINVELMPSSDEGMVAVDVTFRSGTTLSAKDSFMKNLEEMAAADEDIESYDLSISSGSSASLTLDIDDKSPVATEDMVERWYQKTANMTNVDITVSSSGSSMNSMMSSSNKEVDLQGYDRDELKTAAKELQAAVRQVPGVINVTSSVADASTSAEVSVDQLKAMSCGLTPIQVGSAVNNILSGVDAIDVTNDGTEYTVHVEYPEGVYDNLNAILDVDIATNTGGTVPLRDIASIVYTDSMETIMKTDGYYNVSVTATMSPSQKFEAQKAIDALAADFDYPNGVTPTGSMMDDMMMEELMSIFKAIIIAVFLVFLVMAMQFESPKFSMMVMICIPFSLIGSFFLLTLTRATLSMTSMMGFLMLMGIVVNNGILYVDSTNQLRHTMTVEDALVKTGMIRLRPILMTTLTTILSMIPLGLGIGDNGQMMQGMAVVIIGGLTASTILTLILLPTFYMILDGIGKKRRKRKEAEVDDSVMY
ncbi:MAG: efflux RND transporter permease subunit [Lachnospiraceae bacterium]|nr:efflux RND transporter permease subunit [Lachnospiraceae bacterium]